jgi:succinate dehydrogenase / fumarate reductase iron-sulfur subunit
VRDLAVTGEVEMVERKPDDPEQAKARTSTGSPVDDSSANERGHRGAQRSNRREVVTLKVRRQEGQRPKVTWDVFQVPRTPYMTVLGALRAVQREPSTHSGDATPPSFDADCCQGSCGACTMLINGRPRLACRTRIDEVSPKGKPITLAPLGKFPLVRDLMVDRAAAEESLRELHAWVPMSDDPPRLPEVVSSSHAQQRLYALGRCTGCAACLEVCPQYGDHTDFLGPAALSEVQRLNETPMGQLQRKDRLALAMTAGGIAECGKALSCVEVCPVGVPLADALQSLARDTTREALFGWLLGH